MYHKIPVLPAAVGLIVGYLIVLDMPAAHAQSGVGSTNNVIQPGKHVLFEIARGTKGQSLPFPDFPTFGLLPNTGGAGAYIALYRESPAVRFGSCPSGPDLIDVVSDGTATCREGIASAPAPSPAQALLRRDGGCADTDNNSADFQLGVPIPRNSFSSATPCGGLSPSVVQLSQSRYEASEGDSHLAVTVMRTGNAKSPATVDYMTQVGTADPQKDYTQASGTLRFAPGRRRRPLTCCSPTTPSSRGTRRSASTSSPPRASR